MTFDELSSKMLSQLAEDIRKEIQDKGLKDTGSTGDSLEVKDGELLANESLYYLVYGRKPGAYPPRDTIRDWVRRKLGVEESDVNGVAYIISKKIAEDGTSAYQQFTNGGDSKRVNLEVLIDKMHDELMREAVNVLMEINPSRMSEFLKANFKTFKYEGKFKEET